MSSEISFRPYKEGDLNFIRNSWGSSYYRGSDFADYLSPQEFNNEHRPIRDKILQNPNIAIIIACDPLDEDLILGWVLVEKQDEIFTLHYIYVKEVFRKEGLAKELVKRSLNNKPIKITHMTGRAQKIIKTRKDTFKDFSFAKNTIMVRDKYYHALPRGT